MDIAVEDIRPLIDNSSRGSDTINIILSDDEPGMEFMYKVSTYISYMSGYVLSTARAGQ